MSINLNILKVIQYYDTQLSSQFKDIYVPWMNLHDKYLIKRLKVWE